MTRFLDATTWAPDGPLRWRGEVFEDWTQGRTAFGGLLGAAAVRAVAPVGRPLRSLLGAFVGPVGPGPVALVAEVLREGGSTTQIEARVLQGGAVGATFVLAFGAGRGTRVPWEGPRAPQGPAPGALPEMPYVEGRMPAFVRHVDLRWTAHNYPFTATGDPHVQGWARLREPVATDAPLLVALLDAWPPPVWALARGPAKGSSLHWQISLGDVPAAPAGAWWRYDARAVQSGSGYSDFAGTLWDADGNWVASTRQLFAEFTG